MGADEDGMKGELEDGGGVAEEVRGTDGIAGHGAASGVAASGASAAGADTPAATGEAAAAAATSPTAEKPRRTPEEIEAIHARNAQVRAMDRALTDIRQRSYDGKLTKPARWKKLAIEPEGMTAAQFEEMLTSYIEDGEHAEDAPVVGRVEAPKPLEVQLEGKDVDPDEPLPEPSVEDIALIYGKRGTYLYSVALMSHSFAHALFLSAENDDLTTFVDVVRTESRVYPRPVSETSFINAPYLWPTTKTAEVFKKASESGSFNDLHKTSASSGEAYYYSDLYLSEAQAKSLAEWYGVEKKMNP